MFEFWRSMVQPRFENIVKELNGVIPEYIISLKSHRALDDDVDDTYEELELKMRVAIQNNAGYIVL